MSDFFSMQFVGRLGRDPEMRYTPSGKAVTSFSVASGRQYTANNETVKETIWTRVTVWGNQAEACNLYLKKGSRVLVEGRLSPDKATGAPKVFEKKDKTFGATYDVTASFVYFLDTKSEATAQPDQSAEDEVGF